MGREYRSGVDDELASHHCEPTHPDSSSCDSWAVTLTATWINSESSSCSLWMASDSRISDAHGRLLDQGVKLFELPVVTRTPGASGFFDKIQLETSFGLVCSGSTLIFQQVYATLVPTLGNLAGLEPVPSLGDVAGLIARMTTLYARSLGETRPHGAFASLVLAGVDPVTAAPEAFELSPSADASGRIYFDPQPVDLSDDVVLFTGDTQAVREAQDRLIAFRAAPEPGRPYHRAALNVIRELALDDQFATVGGDVQIGYTMGPKFHRVATVTPISPGQAAAQRRLNNVDIDELGPVGPCGIGLDGMVSP
jgi:hypothetical protein